MKIIVNQLKIVLFILSIIIGILLVSQCYWLLTQYWSTCPDCVIQTLGYLIPATLFLPLGLVGLTASILSHKKSPHPKKMRANALL